MESLRLRSAFEMDYEVLESIITGYDVFISDAAIFDDEFILSEIEKCSEYNILNLDNFVPNDLPDADVDLAKEEPLSEANPNVFLLDDNIDRFEALLQSEFEKREMGKPGKTSHRYLLDFNLARKYNLQGM